MSSSTIINIPTDDKVFESNCVVLFAGLLNDPNVKLLGTRGKKQFGLDLIGKRNRDPAQPVGIQCKLITRGAKLSETTVRKEVPQALAIQPALTEFYIVTTATDEPALDFLAIALSQELRSYQAPTNQPKSNIADRLNDWRLLGSSITSSNDSDGSAKLSVGCCPECRGAAFPYNDL